MKLPETLGEFITQKREKLGFKKLEFAKLIGISYGILRKWEVNRFKPAGKNKKSLIEILKPSENELKKYFNYAG